jgi:hypothetical protein
MVHCRPVPDGRVAGGLILHDMNACRARTFTDPAQVSIKRNESALEAVAAIS